MGGAKGTAVEQSLVCNKLILHETQALNVQASAAASIPVLSPPRRFVLIPFGAKHQRLLGGNTTAPKFATYRRCLCGLDGIVRTPTGGARKQNRNVARQVRVPLVSAVEVI